MSKPLTYLSLKCVLEYLEANKRTHMTTRCSALRKMERTIPLHLDQLSFGHSKITLNDITFELSQHANFFGKYDYKNIYLSFKKNLSQYKQYVAETQVPSHLEFHAAMKHIINCLLGSRPEITVNNLKIVDDKNIKILRLLVDLNLKVQELECNSDYIEYFIPIISNLKRLILRKCSWDDSCFELPIIQTVPQLTINGLNVDNVSWSNTLFKLSNREVYLNINSFSKDTLIHFIQLLLDAEKEIGTYYRIAFQPWFPTDWTIDNDLKQRFKAEVKLRIKTDPIYFSITIPKNTISELSVSSSRCNDRQQIEIRVVSTPPKPKPLSWNNVKCVFKYMEENRRNCLTPLCPKFQDIALTRPLHLDYLSFGYSSITLNDITYQIYTLKNDQYLPYALNKYGNKVSADNAVMPDDIRIDSSHPSKKSQGKANDPKKYPVYIGFKKDDSEKLTYSRQVPNNLEFHVAMTRLICFLLGGRQKIRVKQLEIQSGFQEILRLPLTLKLQVQELIAEQNVIEFVSSIVDDRSYPLKKLKIVKACQNHHSFQLQIVQDARHLEILERGLGASARIPTSWGQTLEKLSNQQIDLKCESLKTTSLISYIQYLMDIDRDIGAVCTIDCALTSPCEEMLHDIGRRYNRVARIKQMDSSESDLPIITFSIALPMSSTSDLIISGEADHNYCAIRIEVVSIAQKKVPANPADHISKNLFSTFFSSVLSCVRPQKTRRRFLML